MKYTLDTFHRNSTDEELIDDLRKVAKSIKKDCVTMEEYNDFGQFHSTTLTRRFGSWFKALKKAGLEKTRNLNITNEELFENLVQTWTSLGCQPKYNDMTKQNSKYSAGTYEKRFGSWRKALEAFVKWANDGVSPVQVTHTSVTKAKKTPRNISWRMRAIILMKDGAKCKLCGATPQTGAKLHVDHIKPWSKGGETIPENLQILCDKCNIGKSDIELI